MFEFFSSLEVDGHTISPGYDYDAAKKDMAKRLGRKPEDFFLTRAMTVAEVREDPGMGRALHHLRHAGLSGVPGRQTGADLHRLGHPHAQHQRLEGALLPHDRRPLRALPGNAGPGGLEQIRRGERRGARPALRELHGPLRVRSQRRARHQLPARRQLEEHPLQLCAPSQAVLRRAARSRPSTGSRSAKAISPKPRPRSTPAWRARNPPSRTTGTTATAAALAAAATPPSGTSCWPRCARRRSPRSNGSSLRVSAERRYLKLNEDAFPLSPQLRRLRRRRRLALPGAARGHQLLVSDLAGATGGAGARLRSCWIARRTTSTSSGASKRPRATTTSSSTPARRR